MKAMDNHAINVLNIPSTLLMENAARAVADEVFLMLGGKTPGVGRASGDSSTAANASKSANASLTGGASGAGAKNVAVFAGTGNNGGDGIAAALFLRLAGVNARCFLVGRLDKLSPDAAEMKKRFSAAGGVVECFTIKDMEMLKFCESCDAIVDALFGTGLNSPIRGDALSAVELMNRSPAPVVSADIPSGVETDTGNVLGAAVKADTTVTFTLPKLGHFQGRGGELCGKVKAVDIGIPAELVSSLEGKTYAVTNDTVVLPRRKRDSHKGDYGRLLLLCGSRGYTGAAAFAARAAVRCGSGLVFEGVPESVYPSSR